MRAAAVSNGAPMADHVAIAVALPSMACPRSPLISAARAFASAALASSDGLENESAIDCSASAARRAVSTSPAAAISACARATGETQSPTEAVPWRECRMDAQSRRRSTPMPSRYHPAPSQQREPMKGDQRARGCDERLSRRPDRPCVADVTEFRSATELATHPRRSSSPPRALLPRRDRTARRFGALGRWTRHLR